LNLSEKRDAHGYYIDEFVNGQDVAGYFNGSDYCIKSARIFSIDTYSFWYIKDSHFIVGPDGKLKIARVVSAENRGIDSQLIFINPLSNDSKNIPVIQEALEYSWKDSDGDGLSDYVENKYGFDPGNNDSDGDELSDYEEFLVYDTGVLDNSSGAKQIADKKGLYEIWLERNSPDYEPNGTYHNFVVNGTNTTIFIQDPLPPGYSYDPYIMNYNFLDTDGDGASDYYEFKRGFDPDNDDSDNDGLSDGFEIAVSYTAALGSDTDGDSIPDPIDPFPRLSLWQLGNTEDIGDSLFLILTKAGNTFELDFSGLNDEIRWFSLSGNDNLEFMISGKSGHSFALQNDSVLNITRSGSEYRFIIINQSVGS